MRSAAALISAMFANLSNSMVLPLFWVTQWLDGNVQDTEKAAVAPSAALIYVRNGSLADLLSDITLMSAFGRIADSKKRFPRSPRLNVRFHRKRTMKTR